MKWMILASTLAVVLLFVVLAIFVPSQSKQDAVKRAALTTRELAMSCTTDMATTFHIHPTLKISVDGVDEVIPAQVGIKDGCMSPLHTHDTSGKIHVESPEARDFTLGDFFAVWGKTLARDGFVLTVLVDGAVADYVTGPDEQVLKDDQQIVLQYIHD